MKTHVDEEAADGVLRLGALILQFARIDRATAMEDGVTRESDTDHTVMLGIIACAVAKRYEPTLDVGKIAQFALVHDLVEAYAGDTNTFGLEAHTKTADKESRERDALTRIETEFAEILPWVSDTIREYESLGSREARFLKTLDKVMPKITNVLNEGRRLRSYGGDKEFSEFCTKQRQSLMESYGKDQEVAMTLYTLLFEATERILAQGV